MIVEGLLSRLEGKDREALLALLPQLPSTTRLVFLEEGGLAPNNPFIRLAQSSPAGYVRQFEVPTGRALEGWIQQRVEFHDGAINPRAAALLAANVGEIVSNIDIGDVTGAGLKAQGTITATGEVSAIALDGVDYFPIEEPAAELARYRAGELHVTETIPAGRFAWLQENLADDLRVHPYLGSFWLGLNLRHPVLGRSRELRQALSLAINRDILVRTLEGGRISLLFGLLSSTLLTVLVIPAIYRVLRT